MKYVTIFALALLLTQPLISCTKIALYNDIMGKKQEKIKEEHRPPAEQHSIGR